jgi:hypothetical protein
VGGASVHTQVQGSVFYTLTLCHTAIRHKSKDICLCSRQELKVMKV